MDVPELMRDLNISYWSAREMVGTVLPRVALPSSRARSGVMRKLLVFRSDVQRLKATSAEKDM